MGPAIGAIKSALTGLVDRMNSFGVDVRFAVAEVCQQVNPTVARPGDDTDTVHTRANFEEDQTNAQTAINNLGAGGGNVNIH